VFTKNRRRYRLIKHPTSIVVARFLSHSPPNVTSVYGIYKPEPQNRSVFDHFCIRLVISNAVIFTRVLYTVSDRFLYLRRAVSVIWDYGG